MMAAHCDEADYNRSTAWQVRNPVVRCTLRLKKPTRPFVAEYTALYQGFPKYLEDLVIGFGWGEDAAGQRWFIISANPQGLQHLTYPELVSWDFESFTDIPELIQHAHLDNISF